MLQKTARRSRLHIIIPALALLLAGTVTQPSMALATTPLKGPSLGQLMRGSGHPTESDVHGFVSEIRWANVQRSDGSVDLSNLYSDVQYANQHGLTLRVRI